MRTDPHALSRPSRRPSPRRPRRRALAPRPEPLEPRRLLSAGDVLTYHNDNARTGQDLTETVLKPATLNVSTFGKLFSYPVDGSVFAQPLYASGVRIGRATHNVVFVATTNDSVYAFDADSNLGASAQPLWHTSFLNPAASVTTVPGDEVHSTSFDALGIVGTPVIDRASNTLFVVAMTQVPTATGRQDVSQLHALDLGTGRDKVPPVTVQATVPGTADGGATVSFGAEHQLQRSGLLLLNGVVYVAYASFNITPPYYGWLLGFDARTLRPVSALNVSPDSRSSGIWMSGGAPAADAAGNIFLATGNGLYTAGSGKRDFGDSVLRISTAGGGLRIADSYTPADNEALAAGDMDLGSGGVLLMPTQPGFYTNTLVAGSKDGRLLQLNRDSLGRDHAGFGNIISYAFPHTVGSRHPDNGRWVGVFSTPAYFNQTVYYAGVGDHLKAFPVVNGRVSFTPTSQSAHTFAYPGGTPSVSANGARDGIVWVIEKGDPPVLRAFDAANVARELYNSDMAGPRDRPAGTGVTFTVPTVANGKVFVGSNGALTVYGDAVTGYVNGRASLLAQGVLPRDADRLLATSPNFVWHPPLTVKPFLDRLARRASLPRPWWVR